VVLKTGRPKIRRLHDLKVNELPDATGESAERDIWLPIVHFRLWLERQVPTAELEHKL